MKSIPLAQHIIAIGASAGGMEAIHAFFDHTPLDQVSYVVIQHLSPDHQSRLAELLASHSKLTICVAENDMPVEANRVYVIPNKEYLTIRQGKLYLLDKGNQVGPHMTIDAFFVSLALDQGNKAIGVILSGAGTDGSMGIRAIHQVGGWVIAQDTATAKFSAMPANAIATGLVDAVLAPSAMPGAIQSYVNQKIADFSAWVLSSSSNGDRESVPESEESELIAILEFIKSQLPLDFTEYKRATLFRRIRRRMVHHQLDHPASYLAFLKEYPLELQALAKDFLISVTTFFRDAPAFEIIERDILPALAGKAGEEPLKIWVAGCATGEEAYSLAMLVAEYQDKNQSDIAQREVKIFATDLDQAALGIASRGVYPAGIAKNVLPARLERFFNREGEGFKVKQDIRSMLIFARHDLVKNPPYCHIDLITCRNVLIYLNPSLQKKILTMLHFGLRQGGYLLLGSGENAQLLAPQLQEIDKKWKIYQKTLPFRSMGFESFSLPETSIPLAAARSSSDLARGVATTVVNSPGRLQSEAVSEALMNHFGQVGLCLDEQQRVLQAFGDLTPYLLPKVFNSHLSELMPESLLVAFSVAFNRAVQSNEAVAISGIRNELNPAAAIKLLVKPLVAGKNGQKLLLLLLSPDHLSAVIDPPAEPFDSGEHARQHLAYLEEELRITRDHLQGALEKLDANTENMQSFNEELLSANEEMQSGNEELQSVNEELQTINAEYQMKIRELTDLNDDLNNYFRSNVSGQLFVDRDLLLKKFSPAAVQHINLRESDIGRPLHHITTNIAFDSIVKDIGQVILSGETITREVKAKTGQWYEVMVMAYIRQADQQPIGAMVTFYDITALVQARLQLEESAAQSRMVLEAMPQITCTTGPDGRVVHFNQHWFEYTGLAPEESPEWGWAPALHPLDAERVASHWKSCLASQELFEDEFRIRRQSDGAFRWHLTRGVPIRDIGGRVVKWVSTTTDVQDQRHLLEEAVHARQLLSTTNTILNRSNVDLDNFVYTASHDLRAPVNSLKGLLELLSYSLAGNRDENISQIMTLVDISVTKLLRVISDLTEIAKVQQDVEGEEESIPVREMLNEVLAEFSEQIADSGARIQLRVETDHLVYKRKNLRSILYNLLSNALKYRSPKRVPEVQLTFGTKDNNPVLVVADNGLGLTPTQVDKLFNIYQRFHIHVEGSGIGLFMIKRMVENNGGHIEVSSQEGEGTTFTVFFHPVNSPI
jgi:two-component system, chemotaxis family, CheB/CheR fusion protein